MKESTRIKNLSMKPCSNENKYPVTVYNVTIQIQNLAKVAVSGTLTSAVNLDKPMQV